MVELANQTGTNDVTDDRIPVVLRRVKLPVGQNDKDEPDSIGENQYILLQNVTVSRKGQLPTRYGSVVVANKPASVSPDGLGHFYPAGAPKLQLMLANGVWYKRAAGGVTWTSIKSGLASGARAPHLVGNGYIFVCDQTNNVQSYDGAAVVDEGALNASFPKFSFGIFHQGRFIVGKDTDSLAYYSNIFTKVFDRTTQVLKFGDGDNGLNVAAVDMPLLDNSAFIWFKTNSVYSVDSSAADPANWSRTVIDPTHGCVATRSAVPLGSGPLLGGCLYLSKETSENGKNFYRVRSIQRTLYGTHAPGPVASYDIENTLNQMNPVYDASCAAVFVNNRYILAFPSAAATYNDTIAVLDLTVSDPAEGIFSWQIYTGWKAAIFDIFEESSVQFLYFADASANSQVLKAYSGTSDDGAAIAAKVRGRAEDGGYPENNKTWEFVEVLFDAVDPGPVTVRAIFDNGAAITLGTAIPEASGPNLPINLPFDLQAVARFKAKFPLDFAGICRTVAIEVEDSVLDSQMTYLGYILSGWVENLSFAE